MKLMLKAKNLKLLSFLYTFLLAKSKNELYDLKVDKKLYVNRKAVFCFVKYFQGCDLYSMLYCSSECGSISIMQLRIIYCNTHVYTFHVCLCLLALTFVCNSTYLLKCSFQI